MVSIESAEDLLAGILILIVGTLVLAFRHPLARLNYKIATRLYGRNAADGYASSVLAPRWYVLPAVLGLVWGLFLVVSSLRWS